MKTSNYNFFIKKEDKLFCFNGISKLFFDIPLNNENILINVLKNPDLYKEKIPLFFDKLSQGNFIVEDDCDEIDVIKEMNKKNCNSKHYLLTILPTLNCNFRCWYCYEKHNSYMMSIETIERVKKYISNIINNEGAESLTIEWFGGEPFLGYRNIIKPINLFTKQICANKNIPFYSGATSNGYLISPSIANELESINFSYVQVTLDGEKSLHDKTRVAPKGSSFETILRNMNYACEVNDQLKVTLRINYDDKNFFPERIFSQVNELIEEKYRHRFSFLLRKVWQVDNVKNGEEKIEKFIQLINPSQFKYIFQADFNTNFIPCYAARKNMKLITPHGSIGKCTTKDDFEKEALGYLDERGIVQWKDNIPFDEIYATPLFDNEGCLSCKRLPLCMGICPQNIDTDGKLNLNSYCKGKLNDFSLDSIIANYCKNYNKQIIV